VRLGSLHLAAMNGRNGIAQLMLQAGTEPNAKDWEGETALLKFARQVYGSGPGQSELIKLFIQKGADLDVRDKDGHSPLFYAIDHNQVAVSRLLISAGADATSTFSQTYGSILTVILHINDVPCCCRYSPEGQPERGRSECRRV
jgi:ankyrin repeat protein